MRAVKDNPPVPLWGGMKRKAAGEIGGPGASFVVWTCLLNRRNKRCSRWKF